MDTNPRFSSHQMQQILELAAQTQVDHGYHLDDIVQAGEEAGIPQPLIQEAAATVMQRQQDWQREAQRRLSQKEAPCVLDEIERKQERKGKIITLSAVSAVLVATLASAYLGYTRVSVAFWGRSEFYEQYEANVHLPLEQAANAYTTAAARQGVQTALVALEMEAEVDQYPDVFPDFANLKEMAFVLQNDSSDKLDPTVKSRLHQLKERLNDQTQSVWDTALAYGALTIIFYAFLPVLIAWGCLKCWEFLALKKDGGL